MTRILRIERISNFGVFDNFSWDVAKLPDFSQRNLIYGWNYSGKTTFSRIFQSLQASIPKAFSVGKAKIALEDGSTIALSDEFPQPTRLKVFNSDYVENNVAWNSTNGVEPILMVGAGAIEAEKRKLFYEHRCARREKYAEELEKLGKSISRRLDEGATARATQIRERYGITPFNRRPHLERLIPESRLDATKLTLDIEEVRRLESVLHSEAKDILSEQNEDLAVSEINNEISSLLSMTAKQEVIDRLASNYDLRDWVNKGLKFHQDTSVCQFCEQNLPEKLMDAYAKYFSDSYKMVVTKSDEVAAWVRSKKISINLPRSQEVFRDMHSDFGNVVKRLKKYERRINRKLDILASEAEDKKKKIDQAVQSKTILMDREKRLLTALLIKFNSLINIHNQRCKHLNDEKKDAREKLIRHTVSQFACEIGWWEESALAGTLRIRWTKNKEKRERFLKEIKEINRVIHEAKIGADELNRYLKLYFGKQDIEVRAGTDDRFRLYRGETRAENLSEGERTAIAFSYFVVSLREQGKGIEETIVYIDDPVSSLDANHVFNTFAIIKTELKKAAQVFVSTHDYDFFKLMRGDSFFYENVDGKKRTSLYLVARNGNSSSIISLPDALRKYNSEYHYLFTVLYKYANSGEYSDGDLWLIPNVTRRLLEIYTSFKIPKTSVPLDQRLQKLCHDATVAHRIYKFVNQFSHSDSLQAVDEFPQPSECRDVLKAVFNMIDRNDEGHFEGMKEICV